MSEKLKSYSEVFREHRVDGLITWILFAVVIYLILGLFGIDNIIERVGLAIVFSGILMFFCLSFQRYT